MATVVAYRFFIKPFKPLGLFSVSSCILLFLPCSLSRPPSFSSMVDMIAMLDDDPTKERLGFPRGVMKKESTRLQRVLNRTRPKAGRSHGYNICLGTLTAGVKNKSVGYGGCCAAAAVVSLPRIWVIVAFIRYVPVCTVPHGVENLEKTRGEIVSEALVLQTTQVNRA